MLEDPHYIYLFSAYIGAGASCGLNNGVIYSVVKHCLEPGLTLN
jgi:hypothetical protein